MWANEWTRSRFIDIIYTRSAIKASMADRPRLDSTRYITWQYSKLWWAYRDRAVHSKITVTCALTWQIDHWRVLYTPENGSSLKHCKTPSGGLFLSFTQTFSVLIVGINCQYGVLLKHGFVFCRLCHYGRGLWATKILHLFFCLHQAGNTFCNFSKKINEYSLSWNDFFSETAKNKSI